MILQANAGKIPLADESVDCCVTSPPYWGLRDYSVANQLGLESTPEEYVENMVQVFREVRRVLKPEGTLWLNLGDTMDTKQLQGIPWRVAFALQADGWWLRSDIIWHKPNPMPESVTDRPTKAHEYVFLLTKSARYYYDADAVREKGQGTWNNGGYRNGKNDAYTTGGKPGKANQKNNRNRRSVWTVTTKPYKGAHFATYPPKLIEPCILAGTSAKGYCPECGKPWERVVEKIQGTLRPKSRPVGNSRGISPSDFRSFGQPQQGSQIVHTTTIGWRPTCEHDAQPIPGRVLDPFFGSGTTGEVARKHGRNFVGLDLSMEYIRLAKKRTSNINVMLPLGVEG